MKNKEKNKEVRIKICNFFLILYSCVLILACGVKDPITIPFFYLSWRLRSLSVFVFVSFVSDLFVRLFFEEIL